MDFAKRFFKARLEAEDNTLNHGDYDISEIRWELEWQTALWNLLKALDKKLMLPFKLKDVVDAGYYSY